MTSTAHIFGVMFHGDPALHRIIQVSPTENVHVEYWFQRANVIVHLGCARHIKNRWYTLDTVARPCSTLLKMFEMCPLERVTADEAGVLEFIPYDPVKQS